VSLSCHDDTDAQTAVAQFISGLENYSENDVHYVNRWGEFTEKTESMFDTYNLDFPGVIYDHHGNELSVQKVIDSKLAKSKKWIWFDSCTSVGIYKLFKKHIPSDLRWLHIVGAIADHVPHKIKLEEWEKFPQLTERVVYLSGTKGYLSKVARRSMLGFYLSSWINCGRYIRDPITPLKFILRYDLEDIIFSVSEELQKWKLMIHKIRKALTSESQNSIIIKSSYPRIVGNGVFLWLIRTDVIKGVPSLKVQSRLASHFYFNRKKLFLSDCNVFIVLNLDSPGDFHEVSVRGDDLFPFLKELNFLKDKKALNLHHLNAVGLEVEKDKLKDFLAKVVAYKPKHKWS
jgi:hypothetical protein